MKICKGLWVELVLTLFLILCCGYLLFGLAGCEYEPPQQPTEVVVVDRHGNPVEYDITVNDMEVRVYSALQGWSQWEPIVLDMGASLPEDQVLVMQFRQGTNYSSLAGFSWPQLETCYIMPEHVQGNSAWRVTYGAEPDVYPVTSRIEFKENETHVTQAANRVMYYMVERWDETVGGYVDQSPWFAVRWTNIDNPYHFDQPVGEGDQ